jgi:hypothetical protein
MKEKMMMMMCQVLYNLRNATAWVSGNDLHELFYSLVGDPSPAGKTEFALAKLKEIDQEAFDWLSKREFSLMLETEIDWRVHRMHLTIKEATQLKFRIQKNKVFPVDWNLEIVPDGAVSCMQGLEPASVGFEGGMVILSSPKRYNHHVITIGVDPMDYRYTTSGYWEQYLSE